jgi:hypothetical protein
MGKSTYCVCFMAITSVASFACYPPTVPAYPTSGEAAGGDAGRWAKDSALGREYCSNLERSAHNASLGYSGFGWVAAALAFAAVGASTVVLPNDSSGDYWETHRGSISLVSAVPVGLLAYYWLSRSDATGAAASSAAAALAAPSDRAAYEQCLAAQGTWDDSITRANSLAVSLLQQRVTQVEQQVNGPLRSLVDAGADADSSQDGGGSP